MIATPPGPTVTLDSTQPIMITQRAVTAVAPSGAWESSYYPNYYEYGYTASASATVPNDLNVNVVSYDPTSVPLASPLHIILDISDHDPDSTLYLVVRANLQSGFISDWSKPVLINDPSLYVPPAPTPTPIATPSPTPLPSPTPSPTPSPKPIICPALKFVGVRGSGEKKTDAGGYGATIASVKDIIEKKVPGTSSTPIDYEAIAVGYGGNQYLSYYETSVAQGRQVLDAFVTQFVIDCPHTYIILAGYSQGAQVAGDEFAYLTTTEKTHIAALILIGDPRFNPNQPAVDEGNYNNKLSGVYQIVIPEMRVIEPIWTPNVKSICAKNDPICNYSPANTTKCKIAGNQCAHFTYTHSGWTKFAANWAIKHWRNLPVLSS